MSMEEKGDKDLCMCVSWSMYINCIYMFSLHWSLAHQIILCIMLYEWVGQIFK